MRHISVYTTTSDTRPLLLLLPLVVLLFLPQLLLSLLLSHHTRVPMPSPRGLPAVPCGDARQVTRTRARLKGRRR